MTISVKYFGYNEDKKTENPFEGSKTWKTTFAKN